MIFFGTKVFQKQLPSESKVCPNCLSVTEHTVVEQDTRFTFYFIPLFSIKRSVTYTCLTCGDVYHVETSENQAPETTSQPVAGQAAPRAGSGGAASSATTREKARTILEGKIIGDEIKTRLPLSTQFSFDHILKYLYVALLVIAIVAVSAIILISLLASQ
jgi:hypothetical protein